jgi:hypothetical protein
MAQGFLARVAGKTKQIFAITSSVGAADAGKIPALDGSGRLNQSFMPVGIGADTVQGTASEALSAGDFVNFHDDGGTFSVRLADNSNGRHLLKPTLEMSAASANTLAMPSRPLSW